MTAYSTFTFEDRLRISQGKLPRGQYSTRALARRRAKNEGELLRLIRRIRALFLRGMPHRALSKFFGWDVKHICYNHTYRSNVYANQLKARKRR